PEIFPASSASSTIPDSTRPAYCSRVQWAALAASCSIARSAGTSFSTAERIVTGIRVSTFGLGENLSFGAANVVGFQILGKDRFTLLDTLPTQASDLSAPGIANLLNTEPRAPRAVGNVRVGGDDKLPF